MFSHLCRACLDHIKDPSDAVPLFESYKNISYHRLCSKLGLSLDKNDNLATHLCKKCATEVLKSYKFRLMYMESDKKLREMLDRMAANKKEPNKNKNLVGTKETSQEMENTLLTPLITSNGSSFNGKWKCNTCSAGFTSRARLQQHNKSHRQNNTTVSGQTQNGQKLWSCSHCSAVFQTRKLKTEHQHEHHQNTILNVSVEPSIVIDIDDDDDDEYEYDYDPNAGNEFNDLHFADTTQVDVDNNSADESDWTTDLGLYLIQKNSQLNCFDPLEGDNSTSTMLGHLETSGNHSKVENSSTPNEKWNCNICSKCFRTRDLLIEHKELHKRAKEGLKTEKKEFKNGRGKGNEGDVKPVANKSSSDAELRWKCQTCSNAFLTREMLRIHRRTHFGAKPSTKKSTFEGHRGGEHSKATKNYNENTDDNQIPRKKKKVELCT